MAQSPSADSDSSMEWEIVDKNEDPSNLGDDSKVKDDASKIVKKPDNKEKDEKVDENHNEQNIRKPIYNQHRPVPEDKNNNNNNNNKNHNDDDDDNKKHEKQQPKIKDKNSNDKGDKFKGDYLDDGKDDGSFDEDQQVIWKCSCDKINEESFRFCPQCGTTNPLCTDNKLDVQLEEVLTFKGIINPGKYDPSEKRQTGWLFKNETDYPFKCKVCLERVAGDKLVHLTPTEKEYVLDVKSGEEIFVLVDLLAPACSGKFTIVYQLKDINTKKQIGPILTLDLDVRPKFKPGKENKIKQIVNMGFNERTKIVYALTNNSWNVQKALGNLLGGQN